MARIEYTLTSEGQKQSIIEGGDGKLKQVVEGPMTEDNKYLFSVDEDGQAHAEIRVDTAVHLKQINYLCEGPPVLNGGTIAVMPEVLDSLKRQVEVEYNSTGCWYRVLYGKQDSPLVWDEAVEKLRTYDTDILAYKNHVLSAARSFDLDIYGRARREYEEKRDRVGEWFLNHPDARAQMLYGRVEITLPDGGQLEFPEGSEVYAVAQRRADQDVLDAKRAREEEEAVLRRRDEREKALKQRELREWIKSHAPEKLDWYDSGKMPEDWLIRQVENHAYDRLGLKDARMRSVMTDYEILDELGVGPEHRDSRVDQRTVVSEKVSWEEFQLSSRVLSIEPPEGEHGPKVDDSLIVEWQAETEYMAEGEGLRVRLLRVVVCYGRFRFKRDYYLDSIRELFGDQDGGGN